MKAYLEALITELEGEGAHTRRTLERVPNDKLQWRPHPKSYSLGQLALHVAISPGALCGLMRMDGFDATGSKFTQEPPKSTADLLPALAKSLADAKAYLESVTPEQAAAPWSMTSHGRTLFTVPRIVMIRSLVFNHWYHHRGELMVYLRINNVPVPAIYGPSADEDPFA
jgi:uncharacterized damage-inducible protein DinB